MNKTIIASVFVLIFNLLLNAQENHHNNVTSIEIELNEKAEGFGPKGVVSYIIAYKDQLDSLQQTALPKMKNIPENLSNLTEYYYCLNKFQFFYQNYRNGVFPKDYFLKETTKQKWNLNDTIQLSEKNLKNTISIAAGINSEGIPMYIVDSQNNGDFSDDVLKVMSTKTPFTYEEVASSSLYVDIDCFNGQAVKQEKQSIIIILESKSKNEKIKVSFGFPQFRYNKFTYKNKSYLVCSESVDNNQSIFVLRDIPYFSTSVRAMEIKPFQFVELEGEYFQYIPKSVNTEWIQLKKVDQEKVGSSNQNVKKSTLLTKVNSLPIASQVAMIAPEISGLDILNNFNVSLNSLKGKYVFIDFWSTTCAPCIAEFPTIKEVYEKYDRNQLEIIGIVDDRTSDGKIKEFIQKKKLNWPTINMNIKSTTINGYNIKSYPTTYLINPNGVIIAKNLRGDELLNKLQSLKIK